MLVAFKLCIILLALILCFGLIPIVESTLVADVCHTFLFAYMILLSLICVAGYVEDTDAVACAGCFWVVVAAEDAWAACATVSFVWKDLFEFSSEASSAITVLRP